MRRPVGVKWISGALSSPGRSRRISTSARSSGSTSITIPGPPPYGRSSTRRCGPSPWSRNGQHLTSTRPSSKARRVTPWVRGTSKNSGKSVMTSKRMAARSSEVQSPVDLDASRLQIDAVYIRGDERDQPFVSALRGRPRSDLQHALGAGVEQACDRSEHLALAVDDLEPDQIDPVELVDIGGRKLGARDED